MNWNKKGLIFEPNGNHGFMNSHAQVPTPIILDDTIRVYFATRPDQGLSLTTFIDLDIEDPRKIKYIHDKPVLDIGIPGSFDEHGIMPSWATHVNDKVYLYYSGWQRGYSIPYNNYTGLAISSDGGYSFEKYAHGPVIDRTPWEIYSATSPGCLVDDNGVWHMLYCSGTHWHVINEKYEHVYDIKYAFSYNGKEWKQTGQSAIKQNNEYEGITRPTTIKWDDGSYHSWYCYRGAEDFRNGDQSYRIGYAVSSDMIHWQRHDEQAGIFTSPNEWDSKMQAYPSVFRVEDRLLMFYNGNDFGRSGFGYALMDI